MQGPGQCRSSGGLWPATQHGGPGSSTGQETWDLWWTKWEQQAALLAKVGGAQW
jgi:hypothetical protein